MANPIHKGFIVILVVIFPFLLFQVKGQEYCFRHLTAEDGLPTNFCWAVLKDSRGFVWITSRAGICRYDGYNIKVFQYDPDDSVSLSDNRITFAKCIAEDLSANLWIGTYKGLNRYDPVTETFVRYQNGFSNPQSISSNRITCLYVDRSGTLWIGTAAGGGLNRYLPDQDGFISYRNNPIDPEWKMPGILAICEDRYGVLWLGTSSGVYQFDRKSETFREIEYIPQLPGKASPVIFKFITEDRNGILFTGTQYGFLTYDRSSGKFIPLAQLYNESIDVRWLDIIDDPFSEEYTHLVINSFNLYRYNIHSNLIVPVIQNPEDPSALAGVALKSIYRDDSGILWLPGEFGVNILDPLKSRLESHEGFIPGRHEAESFFEDSRGEFWIGSDQMARYNEMMELINIYDDFPIESGKEKFTSWIWSLSGDRHNNIWIGTDKNGLYLLQDGSSRILRCNLLPNRPIFVYDIFEDSQGIVWIGTDGGLFQR